MPFAWMVLAASRPLEQWFTPPEAYVGYEEGSLIERTCFSILIFAGLTILYGRRERFSIGSLVTHNIPMVVLIGYYGLAVLWSDFPYIAFKRYVKFSGIIVMGLVILTDNNPLSAFRSALRFVGSVLLPLSIVLIKYFPQWGVEFNEWTGARMIVGIAQDKNMLGQICLVCGLFFWWDVLLLRKSKLVEMERVILLQDLLLLFISMDLLIQADSKTPFVALVLGLAILITMKYRSVQRRIGLYIVFGWVTGMILDYTFGLMAWFTETLGRDPTLTNRTAIWDRLIEMATSHLWFGRGFKSFWTTEMINIMRVNEAHNGYLEIVLDTGLVGLAIFSLFLIVTYRYHKEMVRVNFEYGRFTMALFWATVVYNTAEASFSGLFILFFVFITTAVRMPGTLCKRLLPSAEEV